MTLVQRLAYAVAIGLIEACAIVALACVMLGMSFSEWTPQQISSVGIVATVGSIVMANLVLLWTWRRGRGD
jgi:hypothetical protein